MGDVRTYVHTFLPSRLFDLRAGGNLLRMSRSYPVSRYRSPRLRPLLDTPPERIPMSAQILQEYDYRVQRQDSRRPAWCEFK